MKQAPELFVTCSSGLEELLAAELAEIGCKETAQGFRGIYVRDGTMEAIYRINYCSRIASRVLLPLSRFRCRDKNALYREADAIDWVKYIPANKSIAIDANVSNNPSLRNSLFAAQVVKDAICDQIRKRRSTRPNINPQSPDVQLNLFINRDDATISFDTSGVPLNKRGYRQESVEAPIRESLAAGLLRLAQYKGGDVLFDPCCGSGTFLIEAGLIATQTPPGYLRQKWGFIYLPEYSQIDWLNVKNEADSKRKPLAKGLISGIDINKNAAHVTKINLRAAGLHQSIEVFQGDFREYTPQPAPTFLITNPPHGKRLDDVDSLKPLYRALGDFMKQKMAIPARAFVFTGSMELTKEVGLAPARRHVIDNAGVESRLLEFDIY